MPDISHTNQRVCVFIDIQNLYHSAKNLYGGRVNYKKLMEEVVGDRSLVRALAYVVRSDSATGEETFFEALEKEGIELRLKDIQVFSSGAKKADWDVGMAVDAIRMADLADVIVLVTGDGDFVPLVEYLKWGFGRTVEVAAFGRTASGRLKEAADKFYDLDEESGMIFRSPRSRKSARTQS
ncbi:MAG: NYN domain-containing protein [Patescibacteria group bacterium]|nr:NYN domain-containing protein [Patescibacteria group bacterium]